ncbi:MULTISPECIES: phosphotriesterase family protein [Rhizobium/Agrobacterium group]|uniref:Resiniferatoxin-binding phosphotriesterase-related protein n=2 Tax=Rhizobium/Agrobacterium group TaxID=227290 RepID=B9K5G2_ALLAM|nr:MULTISPECIES: phosphotriesterase [Rhizobium/Agrobacterium group]ACM40110.1 resiniferatoxin-binding phosphotriesterase-related protein [Allorhizobium ampelinum S4]MUO28416.1 phosphotriesterase-related protein [Agrobacterium vitis]MUO41298.1 phosphotriesterase-related protein [Agrobacterium vitis]MUP08902.1 phosphotriesterase-related protein [Agrobacterium vitis]
MTSELSEAHIRSGKVMTVAGPICVDEMGVTLMHEHILNDCRCWWHQPKTPERQYLAEGFVCMEILGELRQDPFVNKHNITLDDEPLAITELMDFAKAGGKTVVEPTCQGIGRNPLALRRIAKASGLNIVMGAGYYLASSHPAKVAEMTVEAIADEIVQEALVGVDGTDVKIGLIGEIGVSSDFTAEEEKSLRAAAQAQLRTGLPLMVHLPGWYRLGHKVLDIAAEEGADLRHTVLCHMNPSHDDLTYQGELASRGAFIEYDMIGMDFFYADQQVQCPSDEDAARAIVKLVEMGHLDRILLSHDVFLKMMLSRYGGNGYAYILRHFLPRLQRHGLGADALTTLMRGNPRSVFQAAA